MHNNKDLNRACLAKIAADARNNRLFYIFATKNHFKISPWTNNSGNLCAWGVGATPASALSGFLRLSPEWPARQCDFLVIRDARGDSTVNARFALGKSKAGEKIKTVISKS
ncbi:MULTISPECIES: hypothetical protein [Agrobacterium]|uniref:Uncharacterized protein n=1 Tax=Agrobacterium tumefaciens TaxID=358 RepID=A0AAF0GU34_AGRTU|nr:MULTISPECIES: hypothetical protein [Agrobacterium]WGM58550.1 hypothetical protein CFBP5506_09425 [Agrobacterium tumefaciens]